MTREKRIKEVTRALLGYQPGDKVRIVRLEPSFGLHKEQEYLLGKCVTLRDRNRQWLDDNVMRWNIVGEAFWLAEESIEPWIE